MTDPRPLQVQVAEAYEQGAHDIEICKILRLTLRQFQNYYQTDAKFREVVDIGRVMSQAYWLEAGRKNLGNSKFNNGLWSFNMKNRFGWADKTENVNSEVSDDSVEALSSKLHSLLPKVLKKLYPDATEADLLAMTSTDKAPN